jgi:hypothetical protein
VVYACVVTASVPGRGVPLGLPEVEEHVRHAMIT